jgi:hypothetical protein
MASPPILIPVLQQDFFTIISIQVLTMNTNNNTPFTRTESPSPCPIRIHATVTDLHGVPMRAKQAPPLLRRTASGRLFQPGEQVRRGGEVGRRVHAKGHAGGKEKVGHGREDAVCGAMETREGSYKVMKHPASGDENENHRCWMGELGEEDVGTLGREEKEEEEEGGDADDVWLEIARESAETLRR